MKAFLLSAAYMLEMHASLAQAKSDRSLFSAIVNSPFKSKSKGFPLGLGVVVLLLVNKKEGTIDRIALADTEHAHGAVEYSVKPFHEIRIPTSHKKNIIAKAIKSGEHQETTDWQYLFTPVLTPEEARFNQAGAGIATSVVYPLPDARDGGALIFSYFLPQSDITKQHHAFMRRYAELCAKQLRRK